MKWFGRVKLRVGDTRIKRKFLWLPTCFGGQWRWLEFVKMRQIVRSLHSLAPDGPCVTFAAWCDNGWVVEKGW